LNLDALGITVFLRLLGLGIITTENCPLSFVISLCSDSTSENKEDCSSFIDIVSLKFRDSKRCVFFIYFMSLILNIIENSNLWYSLA
jgi:hypothetical protein